MFRNKYIRDYYNLLLINFFNFFKIFDAYEVKSFL